MGSFAYLLMASLVMGLASYSLSMMVTGEEGPFEIFAKIRDAVGIITDEYGREVAKPGMGPVRTMIAKALMCPYCTSVHVTFGVFVLAILIFGSFKNLCLAYLAALGVARYLISKELEN